MNEHSKAPRLEITLAAPEKHNEIRLRLGDFERPFDLNEWASNYDPLTWGFAGELEQKLVSAMLDRWIAALDGLNENGCVALLFEQSDQYTGWLVVTRASEAVTLRPMWTPDICGWGVSVDDSTLAHLPTGLRPYGGSEPYVMTIADMRADLAIAPGSLSRP
jgi:hypothetical protein